MGNITRMATVTILLGILAACHPHRRPCPMSRYKSIPEDDMMALRELQNKYEESVIRNGIKCHQRMLRHKPSVCKLEASDRLTLTLERVSLAVDVLMNMTNPPLSDLVSKPLEIFSALEETLKLCGKFWLFGDPPSEHVKPWLHHLRRYRKIASSECLQDAVILSLIQLLVEDVKCWANSNHISSQSQTLQKPRWIYEQWHISTNPNLAASNLKPNP